MNQEPLFGDFTEKEVIEMVNSVINEINSKPFGLENNCTFKNGNDDELSEYAHKIVNNSFDEADLRRADRLKNLMGL